jgi:hypothetical protein
MNIAVPSERQSLPAEMKRVPVVAAGNSNAVVDGRLILPLSIKRPSQQQK